MGLWYFRVEDYNFFLGQNIYDQIFEKDCRIH